jgi:hypothetical protein
MSMLHVGSGSVSPAVPFVSPRQFVATSWSRNRKAIVMITNDGPRVRSAITPSSAANAPATTPATGTQIHGVTSIRFDRIASV